MDDARPAETAERIDFSAQTVTEIAAFLRMSDRGRLASRDLAAEIEASIILKRRLTARPPQ